MTSKECEEQLESLVEAWRLNEADLNQTDIEAIKHLLLENKMQQDKITELRIQVSAREEVANKYKEVIEEVRKMISELYDETDDTTLYEITKNAKEFLLQVLDKAKGNK